VTGVAAMMTKINNFIKQFRDFGPDVVNCFSNGMCWYFTVILRERFGEEYKVVYDPIINHFALEIYGRIYDITGDITENSEYNWKYWDEFIQEDVMLAQRICRDCILKAERTE
jgi:hypothetical protein